MGEAQGETVQVSGREAGRVRTMGLASMHHDRTTRMPVVSLSKAKSTRVVTAAGESNAAPGVTEVRGPR